MIMQNCHGAVMRVAGRCEGTPVCQQGDGACVLSLGKELVLFDEFQGDAALLQCGQNTCLFQLREQLQLLDPTRGLIHCGYEIMRSPVLVTS